MAYLTVDGEITKKLIKKYSYNALFKNGIYIMDFDYKDKLCTLTDFYSINYLLIRKQYGIDAVRVESTEIREGISMSFSLAIKLEGALEYLTSMICYADEIMYDVVFKSEQDCQKFINLLESGNNVGIAARSSVFEKFVHLKMKDKE